MAESSNDSGSADLITVKVKTTRETLEVRIPSEATVGDVSSRFLVGFSVKSCFFIPKWKGYGVRHQWGHLTFSMFAVDLLNTYMF